MQRRREPHRHLLRGHYRKWHGNKKSNGTVVINPPGPGKVKIKKEKHR